jgi:hypothetical protein
MPPSQKISPCICLVIDFYYTGKTSVGKGSRLDASKCFGTTTAKYASKDHIALRDMSFEDIFSEMKAPSSWANAGE